MPASTTVRLRAALSELRSTGLALLADVDIRDDMPAGDSAAVQVACVIDVLVEVLQEFIRTQSPSAIRELADHVSEWVADRTVLVLTERAA